MYFKRGDPVCVLTPYPMDLLERCEPSVRPITADPELLAAMQKARESRLELVRKQGASVGEETPGWEMHYFRGLQGDGTKHEGHRTNFRLRPFPGA